MIKKSRKRFYQRIVILGIFLLAVFFHANHSEATDVGIMNLYGTVVDESGNPISGVEVYFGDILAFTTNSDGEYSIWIEEGKQGSLRFEYSNKEIKEITASAKISYQNMYNIDLVYSFPSSNSSAKTVYEDILNKKIGQIVENSGKRYQSFQVNDNVITSGEKAFGSDINAISVKCIHLNYADEWMGEDIAQKLQETGRLSERKYELYVNPMNDIVKNKIQTQVTSNKILCKLFDVKEVNGLTATDALKAICDQGNTITKTESHENLGFSGNQTDSITVCEDRKIDITMNEQGNSSNNNNNNNSNSNTSTINNTVNLNQGNGIIEGYATGCEQGGTSEGVKLVKVELKDENDNYVADVRTNEGGYYKFEGLEGATSYIDGDGNIQYIPKTYTVWFTYGDDTQLEEKAKFNGQDYETVTGDIENTEQSTYTPEATTTPETETPETTTLGTTEPDQVVTVDGENVEIYLVVDCSGSMNTGTDIHYGVNTRLDQAKEGAKQFAEKIFNRYGDKAKIGLTEFETFSGWKSDLKSLSEKQNLINTINSLEIISGYNHTRLDRAVSDTVDYMNEDGNRDTTGNSKRYMIILTDGLSTNEKNVLIDAYTKARNNNITPLTILIDFDDGSRASPNSKGEYVQKNEIPEYLVETGYSLISADEIISSLADTAYTYIIEGKTIPPVSTPSSSSSGSTSITYQESVTTTLGNKYYAVDDSGRRNVVNSYTNTIGYTNGSKIRYFDNKEEGILDSDATIRSELSTNTAMIASTKVTFTRSNQTFKNVNLQLVERAKNEVKVSKTISHIQIYLSDGSQLIDWTPGMSGTNYVLDAGSRSNWTKINYLG